MTQPDGYKDNTSKVCRLLKSIYGTKQASRCWNKKLHEVLTKLGWSRCENDHGMYVMRDKDLKPIMLMATWVDDLIIAFKDKKKFDEFYAGLEKEFELNNLGELSWVVGMSVKRDRSARITTIDQSKYIEKVLQTYQSSDGHSGWTPSDTPFNSNVTLTKDMEASSAAEEEEMRDVPYRSAIGALMYLAVGTRPDIACAVGTCARYMTKPGPLHWQAVKKIFRYLQKTKDLGLTFDMSGDDDYILVGHSDSDWAANRDNRRSTTGYLFRVWRAVVSWKTKLQPTVATSSTEAEYMAASAAAREALWLRQLLKEILGQGLDPTSITASKKEGVVLLLVDNQGAIALASNPVNHESTKHIDIKHHFIREQVAEFKTMTLQYVQSKMNDADILTKTSQTADTFNTTRVRIQP
jgi:hypothetical protein